MKPKLSTKIYESIKIDIVNGTLTPKSFLSESEVAKKFNVSKAPVRDALHLLCEQGYLISFPRKGYMVNVYTIDDLNQIQEIRSHLEKLCVVLTIQNATDSEIESLREFTLKDVNQSDPIKTNNTLFHMRLAEISKNKFLPDVLKDLLNKVSQIKINSKSDLEKHNAIIDALLERDTKKALDCLSIDIYTI